MKNLSDIRHEIDEIDDKLVGLLRRRLEIAAEVAEAKRAQGGPTFDPVREREILNRVMDAAGPEHEKEIRRIF